MAKRIFPSANNVGNADGLPSRYGSERLMNLWMRYARLSARDSFIVGVNDFVPGLNTPNNLNITVGAGFAIINGYMIESTVQDLVAVNASVTNYVFLKYTLDVNNLANAVAYEVNTSGTAPANSIKIAEVIAGGSSVSTITDYRQVTPVPKVGTYTGTAGTLDVTVGFSPAAVYIVGNPASPNKRIVGFSNPGLTGSGAVGLHVNTVPTTLSSVVVASIVSSQRPELLLRGFRVSGNGDGDLSRNALVYNYLVLP